MPLSPDHCGTLRWSMTWAQGKLSGDKSSLGGTLPTKRLKGSHAKTKIKIKTKIKTMNKIKAKVKAKKDKAKAQISWEDRRPQQPLHVKRNSWWALRPLHRKGKTRIWPQQPLHPKTAPGPPLPTNTPTLAVILILKYQEKTGQEFYAELMTFPEA